MQINIIGTQLKGYTGGGESAVLRFQADQDYDTPDQEIIKASSKRDFACSVSGTVLTIPTITTIPTTTDSPTVPSATWTAKIRTHRNREYDVWMGGFRIPHTIINPSWDDILMHNQPPGPQPGDYGISYNQAAALVNGHVMPIANVGLLGRVEIDVSALDALRPIVPGINSPLIRSLLAKRISEVVSGPSHTFDADATAIFVIGLNGNVTSSTISFTPEGEDSKVIIISIGQDAIGGRAFTWPANVLSPPAVDTDPDALTNVMLFWDDGQWIPVPVSAVTGTMNSSSSRIRMGGGTYSFFDS